MPGTVPGCGSPEAAGHSVGLIDRACRSAHPRLSVMPKITASSVAEHRAQVHRRVFDAFAALILDRGHAAITMADLAERAEIGRTAIYHYFRDMDAVVVAYASEETQRYVERLAASLAGVDDPAERMRIYVRQHLAMRDEFHFGFGPELFGMLSGEALVRIRDHVADAEAVLRAILRAGVASGAFDIVDEHSAVSLVHGCLQRRDTTPAALEEFVLRGLGA